LSNDASDGATTENLPDDRPDFPRAIAARDAAIVSRELLDNASGAMVLSG
jgi:hypothetical protein